MTDTSQNSIILIVEDDPDQMGLLTNFARSEIKKINHDKNLDDQQKQTIGSIRIVKVGNIESLKKALSAYKNVMLVILDCNIPDTKGGKAHDQFVKTNHMLTGRHKSVDIIIEHMPNTPITMISSLNRFQTMVTKYYLSEHNISINFISKNNQSMIKKNIGYYLRRYLRAIN